jgi:hypothetical protein
MHGVRGPEVFCMQQAVIPVVQIIHGNEVECETRPRRNVPGAAHLRSKVVKERDDEAGLNERHDDALREQAAAVEQPVGRAALECRTALARRTVASKRSCRLSRKMRGWTKAVCGMSTKFSAQFVTLFRKRFRRRIAAQPSV